MAAPKVLVLHNQPTLPEDHPDATSEHEILYTAEEVANHLAAAGYAVTQIGVGNDPAALLGALCDRRPDAVFNLFEGTHDHGQTEAFAAGLLEWLEVPFTGSPFDTLALARNKHLTKRLLRGAGLPTPEFFVVEALPVPPCPLEWPVIVKPAAHDASVGIDQASVVTSQEELEGRVAHLRKHYGGPVLVEEFVAGREFNVSVIELPDVQVLPLYEIVFQETAPGYWPILTYDAKWRPESPEYTATPSRYPAEVSGRLAARLRALALRAYRLLGCRDYARIDFRVSPSGRPSILEANPNPALNPLAGFAVTLEAAGWTHERFTVELVRQALARGAKGGRRRRVLNGSAAVKGH
jgi:D-alanine-D-alanine ligase